MHRCQYELFVTHDPRVVPLSRSVFAHNHLPCCESTRLATAQLNFCDAAEDEKHLAVRGGMQPPIPRMFGLDYPVMSAPMAMHSGGRLAAAVSKAGALGSFGGIHRSGDPNWVRGEADRIRAETDRPFAIGFITNFIPMLAPLFDA